MCDKGAGGKREGREEEGGGGGGEQRRKTLTMPYPAVATKLVSPSHRTEASLRAVWAVPSCRERRAFRCSVACVGLP